MNATEKDLLFTRLNTTFPVRALVLLGKALGRMLPLRNRSAIFFFFPFYHVGGAEKVHAEIVRCFDEEKPWVFFTKKSANNGFLPAFGARARLFDVWFLLKYGYPFSVGVMAGFIGRHRDAVVFGSNSLFFSLLLEHLDRSVRAVDLVHAFGGGSEIFTLPQAGRLQARVAINRKTIADLREQYARHGLPEELNDRVVLIENCVEVPPEYPGKERRPGLKALYVGRGSEEKRVHLVGRVAARCRETGIAVEVTVVGDARHAVGEAERACCTFLGEISDPRELARLYDEADVLLLTSSREGFPMVIMEGMAHGVVPVSTPVGGIPVHVSSGGNGWLVDDGLGEDEIVAQMCRILARMSDERDLLSRMSRAAYDYARTNFHGERFSASYQTLLLEHR